MGLRIEKREDKSMISIARTLILLLFLTPNILGQTGLSSSMSGLAATFHTDGLSFALSPETNDVVIRDGWIQEGPSSQTITAAYMVIENFREVSEIGCRVQNETV